jgi:acyl dehydratase
MSHYTPTTPEKYWDEASEADACTSPSYEVTVHIDEAYAKTTPFGTRVAHGLFGLSIADGLKTRSEYRFVAGMSLGWNWDFVLPIKINDVVHVRFTVTGLRQSKSRPGWGIVILPSELINQHGQVVQKGEHRLMIPMRSSGMK